MDITLLKRATAMLAGVIFLFFGNEPTVLKVVYFLFVAEFFDIFVGLGKMVYLKQKFDYRFFARGLVKKIMYLSAVSFGYYLDKYDIYNASISFESSFATAFITVEIFSIYQSFSAMGFKLPLLDKYIKVD